MRQACGVFVCGTSSSVRANLFDMEAKKSFRELLILNRVVTYFDLRLPTASHQLTRRLTSEPRGR